MASPRDPCPIEDLAKTCRHSLHGKASTERSLAPRSWGAFSRGNGHRQGQSHGTHMQHGGQNMTRTTVITAQGWSYTILETSIWDKRRSCHHTSCRWATIHLSNPATLPIVKVLIKTKLGEDTSGSTRVFCWELCRVVSLAYLARAPVRRYWECLRGNCMPASSPQASSSLSPALQAHCWRVGLWGFALLGTSASPSAPPTFWT